MVESVGSFASVAYSLEPFVELSFPIQGKYIPADHGYGFFAASVNLAPEIREHSDISILTIPGIPDKQGKILLTTQSCLKIRVPVSKIPIAYQLAGKRIQIGKHEIQIGIPKVDTLHPSATLRSRIVTIKGKDYTQPDAFIAAVERKLEQLEIQGRAVIPIDHAGNLCRKTIKIQRFTIVGFTTEVSELSDEDSLKLQKWGIGGKRHMGCGYFLPKAV